MENNTQARIKDRELLDRIKKQRCACIIGCFGPIDPDHVTTRGAGGHDTEDNIMPLCRKHHQEKGQVGYGKMIAKYRGYKEWLLKYKRFDVFEKAKRGGYKDD